MTAPAQADLQMNGSRLEALIAEADRQMTICNACRYCEGFCAVFPAMELRRSFNRGDLLYMANLCFECRACYYACPYIPPHEYAVNIPQVFSDLRLETYRQYTGFRPLTRLFAAGRRGFWAFAGAVVAFVFVLALIVQGPSKLFSTIQGEGAFYEVVPYLAMVAPAMVLSGFWLWALLVGGVRFWRNTGGSLRQIVDAGAFLKASRDAFGLQYLKGGGDGCNYPDERFSMARRWYHHLLFYGIVFDFASTSIAAIQHNLLGQDAPYPYLSAPVILGTIGGVMILIGAGGLLWLKRRADPAPAEPRMLDLDVAFIGLLLVTAVSGLVLLVLRESSLVGALLVFHLGVIAALYLTLPYGKFAHVVYRYAALIQNQIEIERDVAAAGTRH
jgi:citrate/tricarballylate utilization protein